MECNCPRPTSLTAIDDFTCGVNMKQIQRLGFQRTQSTAPFTATTILALASWQTLLSATDDTKIVVTPLLGGEPKIGAGDAITTGGGDNSTLNGVEEVEGVNPAPFTAFFKSLPPAIEKQLKQLACETELTVYFFLQGGKIGVKTITGTPNTHKGFDIQTLFVSDRQNDGYGTKDKNNVSFYLTAGWSEDLEIVTPSFNPLTEL